MQDIGLMGLGYVHIGRGHLQVRDVIYFVQRLHIKICVQGLHFELCTILHVC